MRRQYTAEQRREFVEEQDELPVARGRVLPRETLVRMLRGSVGLVWAYEEMTEDVDDNRLLLWALDRARRAQAGSVRVRTLGIDLAAPSSWPEFCDALAAALDR